MKVLDIHADSLIQMSSELLGFNSVYIKKTEGQPALFGNKLYQLLSQVSVLFELDNLYYIDLLILKGIGHISNIEPSPSPINISGIKDDELEKQYPDVKEYCDEYMGFIKELNNKNFLSVVAEDLSHINPLGTYNFKCNLLLEGLVVLSLFDGTFESTIYKLYPDGKIDDIHPLMLELMKGLNSCVSSRYLKFLNKRGLVEDTIINNTFFDYVSSKTVGVTLMSVDYKYGKINFTDTTKQDIVNEINSYKASKKDMGTQVILSCNVRVKDYLDIATKYQDIIDVLYSESLVKLINEDNKDFVPVSDEVKRHIMRFNVLNNHSNEIKNLMLDKYPHFATNFIIEGQMIKILVRVDINTTIPKDNEPLSKIANILDTVRSLLF